MYQQTVDQQSQRETLVALTNSLQADQNSLEWGALAASLVGETPSAKPQPFEETGVSKLKNEITSQIEDSKFFLQDLASDLGLAVGFIANGQTISHKSGSLDGTEPCLMVVSSREFQSLLEACEQGVNREELKVALSFVSSSLIRWVKSAVDTDGGLKDGLALFDCGDKINVTLTSFKLEHQAQILSGFNEVYSKGYLREFINAERQNLLEKVGEGFGPSTWHIDATAENLEKRWSEAIQLLEQIGESHTTDGQEFFRRLKSHLVISLEHSIKKAALNKHPDVDAQLPMLRRFFEPLNLVELKDPFDNMVFNP